MVDDNLCVKDYMVLSPLFVYKESSLYNALEIMKFYDSENIAVIDEDFTILGVVTKNQIVRELNYEINLKNLKKKTAIEVLDKLNNPMVLYTGTTLNEAYSVLKCLNLKGLPVVDLPWDKKIKGYVWLTDIAGEVCSDKLGLQYS